MLPWDEVPISDYPLVTEVMINIKKSKTDQNRVGASRSVERTGQKLCAVEAILNFLRLRMEHGICSDDDLPFMSLPNRDRSLECGAWSVERGV